MRKPTLKEFEDYDGYIDYEGYEEAMGDYEDSSYDEWRDSQWDRYEENEKKEG